MGGIGAHARSWREQEAWSTALCVLPGGQLVLERRPLMAPSPQRCRDSKGSRGGSRQLGGLVWGASSTP